MTEAEWLTCELPGPMLWHLRDMRRLDGLEVSERKWRLLACAFCRHIWHLLPDELSRSTIELCECYVDGLADPQPLWARGGIESVVPEQIYEEDTVELKAYCAARFVGNRMEIVFGSGARTVEEFAAFGASSSAADANVLAGLPATEAAHIQCHAIRDIVGNPLRPRTPNPDYQTAQSTKLIRYSPVAFDPAWQTDAVLSLARQAYESRDFSAMPMLADAFQDAGCDSAEILDHCRGPGPHIRGCWVVDLVLGKK